MASSLLCMQACPGPSVKRVYPKRKEFAPGVGVQIVFV